MKHLFCCDPDCQECREKFGEQHGHAHFGCDSDKNSEPKELVTMLDVIFSLGRMAGKSFEEIYLVVHNEDNGKYKVGEIVQYIGPEEEWAGGYYKILASNVQDDENTEYLLKDFPHQELSDLPHLVWENEIRLHPVDFSYLEKCGWKHWSNLMGKTYFKNGWFYHVDNLTNRTELWYTGIFAKK